MGLPSLVGMILAGASVDDIFVIVLFSVFTNLSLGKSFSLSSVLSIPISILLGIVIGIIVGFLILKFYEAFNIDDILKVIILLSVSFILIWIEEIIKIKVPFSALLSIMSIGLYIHKNNSKMAINLSNIYNKMWRVAEIFLFVLVGAEVEVSYATSSYKLYLVVLYLE